MKVHFHSFAFWLFIGFSSTFGDTLDNSGELVFSGSSSNVENFSTIPETTTSRTAVVVTDVESPTRESTTPESVSSTEHPGNPLTNNNTTGKNENAKSSGLLYQDESGSLKPTLYPPPKIMITKVINTTTTTYSRHGPGHNGTLLKTTKTVNGSASENMRSFQAFPERIISKSSVINITNIRRHYTATFEEGSPTVLQSKGVQYANVVYQQKSTLKESLQQQSQRSSSDEEMILHNESNSWSGYQNKSEENPTQVINTKVKIQHNVTQENLGSEKKYSGNSSNQVVSKPVTTSSFLEVRTTTGKSSPLPITGKIIKSTTTTVKSKEKVEERSEKPKDVVVGFVLETSTVPEISSDQHQGDEPCIFPSSSGLQSSFIIFMWTLLVVLAVGFVLFVLYILQKLELLKLWGKDDDLDNDVEMIDTRNRLFDGSGEQGRDRKTFKGILSSVEFLRRDKTQLTATDGPKDGDDKDSGNVCKNVQGKLSVDTWPSKDLDANEKRVKGEIKESSGSRPTIITRRDTCQGREDYEWSYTDYPEPLTSTLHPYHEDETVIFHSMQQQGLNDRLDLMSTTTVPPPQTTCHNPKPEGNCDSEEPQSITKVIHNPDGSVTKVITTKVVTTTTTEEICSPKKKKSMEIQLMEEMDTYFQYIDE